MAPTKELSISENIIFWFLPPYNPALNPVELIWRKLMAKYFNKKTFKSLDEVDNNLIMASNDDTKDHNKIKRLAQSSIQ
jgi:transposase